MQFSPFISHDSVFALTKLAGVHAMDRNKAGEDLASFGIPDCYANSSFTLPGTRHTRR